MRTSFFTLIRGGYGPIARRRSNRAAPSGLIVSTLALLFVGACGSPTEVPTSATCTSDKDCHGGLLCYGYVCVEPTKTHCTDDTQCLPDDSCDTQDGVCVRFSQ